MPKGLAERFWEKVAMAGPDECWIWTDKPTEDGYGRFKITPTEQVKAHRLSYVLATGNDPGELLVRHKCDNPLCVNPAHLELGTQADNMRDASERGRLANQNKTMCPKGHPYDEKNTHIDVKGRRECRICRREASRHAYWRKIGYTPPAERAKGNDDKAPR
jgi:hypothetical protein